MVSLGDQESLAPAFAEHVVVNRPLAETRAIVEEYRLDHLRIHDESVLQPEIAIDDYWLVVKVLARLLKGFLTISSMSQRKLSRRLGGTGSSGIVASKLMFDTFSDELICSFKSWT